jgi:hypothetical protein
VWALRHLPSSVKLNSKLVLLAVSEIDHMSNTRFDRFASIQKFNVDPSIAARRGGLERGQDVGLLQ